jgi:hypothetical protein
MKNMKRQTAVSQSSLNSAPLFIALFSILLPGRLVALDLTEIVEDPELDLWVLKETEIPYGSKLNSTTSAKARK